MVKNVGSESAVRAVVFESSAQVAVPDGPWERPVRIAALAQGEERGLAWLSRRNVARLGITYDSIDGARYSTTCRHDANEHFAGNVFPPWDDADIEREWEL
jgi:hypothetical protein